jgi:ABC-type phosphate transport system substrate-binding protein
MNFPQINFRERSRSVLSPKTISLLALAAFLTLVLLLAAACGGSKANVRQEQANSAQPVAIDVTTAAAILRELPQYFEATGSLTGDEQTDVAPSMAG